MRLVKYPDRKITMVREWQDSRIPREIKGDVVVAYDGIEIKKITESAYIAGVSGGEKLREMERKSYKREISYLQEKLSGLEDEVKSIRWYKLLLPMFIWFPIYYLFMRINVGFIGGGGGRFGGGGSRRSSVVKL